ncbi:TetR/AcrR family transcriptional regulator [Neoaquamicrobium sediminum]|uniref:TetR/AcrR family transcriptional regulator n=1 Tax=Neoaquamicrobium sediminum TaxID=1849104 RepID=UPI0019D67DC3|nr:TetR/AcrR family transcriptional regulator [Mesorhizobium sediminum]
MSNGAATRTRRSREKIIAAAEEVFLHNGFLGANMDTVAEHAGVSKQTVYAHFHSKEALFIQVVEAMTGGLLAKSVKTRRMCSATARCAISSCSWRWISSPLCSRRG